MTKKIYQCPCACAIKLIGSTILANSIIIGDPDKKISDEEDIGFVREQNPGQGFKSIWSNEW